MINVTSHSISEDDFNFLSSQSGKKILEIGTGSGNSINALMDEHSIAHTIDVSDNYLYPENERVIRYHIQSKEWFDQYEERDFDLVFIDGWVTQKECYEVINRLAKRGSIILHDYIPELGESTLNKGGTNYIKMMRAIMESDIDFKIREGGTECLMIEYEYNI